MPRIVVLGRRRLGGIRRGSNIHGWISARLWCLIVGRVLWMLERLTLPHAAVHHTGQMHCHGEYTSRVTAEAA